MRLERAADETIIANAGPPEQRSAPLATIGAMHVRLAEPVRRRADPGRSTTPRSTGSTATFDLVPRTLEEQLAWLADHRGPYPAVVAVDDDDIVLGFGSLSAYRDRPAYATTVENSVYVDADHRGAGVGRALLEELIRLATQHGFHSIIARIGGDNQASIAPPPGLRVRAWSGSSGRSGASSTGGSTSRCSSGCSDRPGPPADRAADRPRLGRPRPADGGEPTGVGRSGRPGPAAPRWPGARSGRPASTAG